MKYTYQEIYNMVVDAQILLPVTCSEHNITCTKFKSTCKRLHRYTVYEFAATSRYISLHVVYSNVKV